MWKSPECFLGPRHPNTDTYHPCRKRGSRTQNWSSKHLPFSKVILAFRESACQSRCSKPNQNWNAKVKISGNKCFIHPKELQPKPISVAIARASKRRNVISTQNPSWFKRSIFREIFRCGACKKWAKCVSHWVTNHSTIHLPIGSMVLVYLYLHLVSFLWFSCS